MAEKGAYLTGTTFAKPSIFELIAQESLALTVEPAFKKIFSFIISFNHERYGHLLQWVDEGYMIFNAILQKYYLNKYSASFSETFYGLKRTALIGGKLNPNLSKKQRNLSLIIIVLFPYIKAKLDNLSQKYKLAEVDGNLSETKWHKIVKKYIVKSYTTCRTLYEVIALCNYMLYVSGRSAYSTPILKLLRITLIYTEMQSVIPISELLQKIRTNTFTINNGLDVIQRTITRSLELGAFFLQFISWWTHENYYSNITALPIPSPPKIPEKAKYYKGLCPLCLKKPRIHTVLIVSGFVFCYQCILPVIRKTKCCPLTNYPANEDDLIHLYVD